MNLIQPLCSGVRGAENGTVGIYRRGTSLRAAYYPDFEASTGSITPTADLSLDSNGGFVAYVAEMVDCIVKDSDGATVREFVAGANDASVEVQSQSFTGTNYETGASAAGQPVDLGTVLDLWKTSAGTTDFKVLISSVATTLQVAFSSAAAAMFINVKSSSYGAVGDGVADDTAAISAASAAQAATGGIVYFPTGTYRTTATVFFSGSVMGAGANKSIIQRDSAGGTTVDIQASSPAGGSRFFRDLWLKPKQANTGSLLTIDAGDLVLVSGCAFGGNGLDNGTLGQINCSANALIIGNRFSLDNSSNYAVRTTGTVWAAVIGNQVEITAAGAYGNPVFSLNVGGVVAANLIDLANMTSGTPTVVTFPAITKGGLVVGNTVTAPGGGTPTFIDTPGNSNGLFEACNTLGAGIVFETSTTVASAASHEGFGSFGRDKRRYYLASDAAGVTAPAATHGTAEIARATNGNQTVTFHTPPGPGQRFTLVLNNNQAALSGVITMGGPVKGLANFTVNANRFSAYHFVSVEVGVPAPALYWSLVGSDLNETP